MAKYKALKRGYDGSKVIEIGEEFEFSGKPGKWMELIDDSKPAPKAQPKAEEKPKASAPKVEGK